MMKYKKFLCNIGLKNRWQGILDLLYINKWRKEKRIENPELKDCDCKSQSAQYEVLGHTSKSEG